MSDHQMILEINNNDNIAVLSTETNPLGLKLKTVLSATALKA